MMAPNFQVVTWRLYLLLPLLLTLSATAHTCCVDDPHTLSELLLHDATNRKVFHCQVLESFVDTNGLCFSRASVQQVFKGNVDSADVWLVTGEIYSSNGCYSLKPRTIGWYSVLKAKPGWFGAGDICDRFSTTANRYGNSYETYLPIVTDFRDKTAAGYSARSGGSTETGVSGGRPNETGKSHGTVETLQLGGQTRVYRSLQEGLLHGERNRADPAYLHREICRFQHGKLRLNGN
ncbi:MAG: hypothetical protein IPM98_03100 [Lewinellaceae bacterium]|nr:hypothetical protein [Lewinellaceae bacterium]